MLRFESSIFSLQGATDMAEEVLKVTRHPNYAVLTLNRPEKRNALNQPLIDAINEALLKFENDKEIRALLLRGEGSSFCAGIDLKEVDEAESGHNPTRSNRFSADSTASRCRLSRPCRAPRSRAD